MGPKSSKAHERACNLVEDFREDLYTRLWRGAASNSYFGRGLEHGEDLIPVRPLLKECAAQPDRRGLVSRVLSGGIWRRGPRLSQVQRGG